jgi:hypothetical protein
MKVYEVVQKYFDNGQVIANSYLLDLPELPENKSESTKKCDIYRDYFTDPVEAESFRQEALNA